MLTQSSRPGNYFLPHKRAKAKKQATTNTATRVMQQNRSLHITLQLRKLQTAEYITTILRLSMILSQVTQPTLSPVDLAPMTYTMSFSKHNMSKSYHSFSLHQYFSPSKVPCSPSKHPSVNHCPIPAHQPNKRTG